MKTVLVNTELSFKGIEMLENAGFKVINQHFQGQELIDYINKETIAYAYLSVSDVNEDILKTCPSLKILGCDEEHPNFDELQAIFKDIRFVNTTEASSQAVAELVFGHLLGMVRFLYDSNRQMPLEGEVNFDGMQQAYGQGSEIKGKTLGIIGLKQGAIATIKMALALGMEVLVFDKDVVKKTIALDLPNGETYNFEIDIKPLEEVCMKSDFISMHVLKEDDVTISKEAFELMKMGVCLVNTSDSGVIDEVELLKAMDSGIVKHAALDCFDNQPRPDMRVLMNPNISLSPNIAKRTKEVKIKIGEVFAKALLS